MFEVIKKLYERSKFGEHPSEQQIVSFEKEWRCALPEDFRSFILEYGCWGGSFGTHGGHNLLRMQDWFDGFCFDPPWFTNREDPDPLPTNWLAEPCPLTPDLQVMNFDSELYSHISKEPLPGESPYDTSRRIHKLRWEIFKDWKKYIPPYKIDPFQGCITISYGGCSYYDALIVTGPARGRILHMECEGQSLPHWAKAQNFSEYCKKGK